MLFKQYIRPLSTLILTSLVFWFLVGSTLSYRAYLPSGEFLYNAPYHPFVSVLISIGYALIYLLIVYSLFKLPKVLAWVTASLFTLIVIIFLILNWLSGVRPDVLLNTYKTLDVNLATTTAIDSVNNDAQSADMLTYADKNLGIRFTYPISIPLKQITSITRDTQIGPIELIFPKDSVQLGDAFVVSRIAQTDISHENAITDWYSCCSGIRYWYDVKTRKWFAEEFEVLNPDAVDMPKNEKIKKKSLVTKQNLCRLEETYNTNIVYKIISTEEGILIDTSYYLMTDDGSAIRFSTNHDLTSGDAKSKTLTAILRSVVLLDGNSMRVGCGN